MSSVAIAIVVVATTIGAGAFVPVKTRSSSRSSSSSSSSTIRLEATDASKRAGGFAKSYGDEAKMPIKDMIDSESAMKEFFTSNEEWMPLFRSISEKVSSVPASSFLRGVGSDDNIFEFHESTQPWRRLEAIPTDEDDRKVLADFLDNMHLSLVEIPVDESTVDDDNDLHFLEEGRRMLVVSRFHVLSDNEQGSIESYDRLFSTCWSELMYLRSEGEENTGSLVVVPNAELADLRRFTDMYLQRPLQWLGITDFEVASLQRGSPAIRLIHKLGDIPTDVPTEPER